MGDIHGYRVVTHEGKLVGYVAGESEVALVVACGTWPRKSWHALPKRYASIEEDKGHILMQVSKEVLVQSPKLKQDVPVDDKAVGSWWGLD